MLIGTQLDIVSKIIPVGNHLYVKTNWFYTAAAYTSAAVSILVFTDKHLELPHLFIKLKACYHKTSNYLGCFIRLAVL